MTDVKQIEKLIKKRDEVLEMKLSAEKGRLEKPEENQMVDVWEDKDGQGIIIDGKRFSVFKEPFDLFLDMLSGNRLLTKQVEVLKLIINKYKISDTPSIIKSVQFENKDKIIGL